MKQKKIKKLPSQHDDLENFYKSEKKKYEKYLKATQIIIRITSLPLRQTLHMRLMQTINLTLTLPALIKNTLAYFQ